MKPTIIVVGSRLLDPTQTQHRLVLGHLEEYQFLLVSKRLGDKSSRQYALPPHAQWIGLREPLPTVARRARLVHLVTGGQIAFRVVRWAAEQGIPAIVSFHGGKDLTASFATGKWSREYDCLFRLAAAITVPAPEGLTILERQSAVGDKVRVLPPSIEVPPDVETERPIPLLFAGRWLSRKRPEMAIEVAAHVAPKLSQRHALHLVGEGPQASQVARALARTRISDRVKNYGYIPYSRLTQLARRARVVLTTSKPGRDLLPPFLLEAQAAGAVAVAVGGPISSSALADPAFRFETVESAAACCLDLLTDDGLWARASARARDHVSRHFSAARNIAHLRDLYRELTEWS